MKRNLLSLALTSAILCSPLFAATTITSNAIAVKVNILPTCSFMVATQTGFDTALPNSIVLGPELQFPDITPDPGAGPTFSSNTAAAIVRCTKGTMFTTSTYSQDGYVMTGTAPPFDTIPYTVDISAPGGTGLGMGTLVGPAANIPITVQAKTTGPAAVDVTPGSYQDLTLTLKITY